MSIIDISITAGNILTALEQRGGIERVSRMACARQCSQTLLLMAVGWLFKEGLVTVHAAAGDWVLKKTV